ncbi:unnamed protein product [Gongylonema pulchrum]|uniref:Uncharacterized protein n=1 Tax=Gongylonema pulchrum TaxID=637853 RepID=A0A183DJ71_9BILA|nr:unnamed protein product [Gongylonema pulchrum]
MFYCTQSSASISTTTVWTPAFIGSSSSSSTTGNRDLATSGIRAQSLLSIDGSEVESKKMQLQRRFHSRKQQFIVAGLGSPVSLQHPLMPSLFGTYGLDRGLDEKKKFCFFYFCKIE